MQARWPDDGLGQNETGTEVEVVRGKAELRPEREPAEAGASWRRRSDHGNPKLCALIPC
jgi:hypothetical protein